MDMYDRINDFLDKRKLRKSDLSKNLNIPYSTIASMFQRHSTGVDVEIIKKIADYLNTTVEYLVNGNEKYKIADNENYSNCMVAIKDKGNKKYFQLTENDFNAILTILEKCRDNKWKR